MLTEMEVARYRKKALQLYAEANIVIAEEEKQKIEIADFGFGKFGAVGLSVLIYVNTKRCCAKELAMLPGQTCPEHLHPSLSKTKPGKEETFRCRWGKVYLHVPGPETKNPKTLPPSGFEAGYTVWREIELKPGEQYTLTPDTLHWFQAGPDGAVVSEFSTSSTDEQDVFTDPAIVRATRITK